MTRKSLDLEEQKKTPFLDAYVSYIQSEPVCFDVPGHKRGGLETDLSRKISPLFEAYDVNAPYGLDNLANPKTVLKEAEELAAKACHADHCIFSVNGTTGGILTILLACLENNDKIILPRNVHKSVINGLILSGAYPVYVKPDIDQERGIACGMPLDNTIKAMDENPDAKAVFVINPTYFGTTSDLRRIVMEAHKRNMLVICDEAHGSNFYFSDELPLSAMDANADITSMSLHKNSGSLTQTSLILTKGNRIDQSELMRAFKMVTSTSPNSLLMCSIDAARKEMVMHGKEILSENIKMANRLRQEIENIDGVSTYGSEYIDKDRSKGRFNLDLTKVVIDVTGLNMYGYDAYKELRMKYNIQVELGEVSVILVLVGPGTKDKDIDRLVDALKDMSKNHYDPKKRRRTLKYHYSYPTSLMRPRMGYEAKWIMVNLKDSKGRISAETVMAYPPGIPVLIPGEIIDEDSLKLIDFYRKEGGEVIKDSSIGKIKVVNEI